MKLVWNAIVKNESAIIDRCVKSLLPHIDGAIVVDTGSTDGTPERLKELFQAANTPIEISSAPFKNFEQARNEALRCARLSKMEWDYLLLADADMELKVYKPNWINGAKGQSYDLRQTTGSLGYFNRRLVRRDAKGGYVGVTHEYLDVESGGPLNGAEFIDHADGANRPEKLQRDINLLETELKTETRPGLIERYYFYLAGSYFDLGNFDKAAEHYSKRVTLGGYDEERWYAQMRYALCHLKRGNFEAFIFYMLEAYEMRPQRAEPLYELTKFFRERGKNYTSLLFSEAGLKIPQPSKDLLFVSDWVYQSGLREDFAVCAYYDPQRRSRGAAETNKLALEGSNQARGNMFWYLKPLLEHVPSFKPEQIPFQPPKGYVATNPSVINDDGTPLAVVRTVNYTITPEGQYAILGTDGTCNNGNPIRTRNFLARLNSLELRELWLPDNWPDPQFDLVLGFEDSRLFLWRGELWTSSTVREFTREGWCEQVLAPLGAGQYSNRWMRVLPKERHHEKNWMPWVKDDELRFVYRLGTLINVKGEVIFHDKPNIDISNISGGSQVIQLDENLWVALVHEARTIPGRTNRYYCHRFVSFSGTGRVNRISPAFYFHDRQIEFAAGLALFGDKLMVSYGVKDSEAWTATMNADDVIRFIDRGEP